MTSEEKLEALRKAWGCVEVSEATVCISGWKVWLVKNYTGKPIFKMNGQKLPGNPEATRKIEFSGPNLAKAIDRAYRSTIARRGNRGRKDLI